VPRSAPGSSAPKYQGKIGLEKLHGIEFAGGLRRLHSVEAGSALHRERCPLDDGMDHGCMLNLTVPGTTWRSTSLMVPTSLAHDCTALRRRQAAERRRRIPTGVRHRSIRPE
jgi:hypothetical protein